MAVKCDRCGLESEIELAFVQTKEWFGLRKRRYCPTCWQKRQQRSLWANLVYISLAGLLGLVIRWLNPASWVGYFYLSFFWLFVLMIPLIVVHELAHVSVARLMGLRVFTVTLGFGRLLASRRLAGIRWELRPVPLGGLTLIGSPQVPHFRLRLFLSTLAGPASHLILLGILLPLSVLSMMLGQPTLVRWITTLAWASGALLLTSLVPFRSYSSGVGLDTDGRKLWQLIFSASFNEQEYFVSYYIQESLEAYQQSDLPATRAWVDQGLKLYPDHPLIQNALGFTQIGQGEFKAARETFVRVLANPEIKPELKYLLFNNIAYANLVLQDPALLPEAQAYSALAYQNAPWILPIVGTQGAVLVETGRIDQGIPLLKKAMAGQPEAKSKAANGCYLVIAECRRGNFEAARRYLDAVRKLDPGCYLLPRAEKELGLASPSIPPVRTPFLEEI